MWFRVHEGCHEKRLDRTKESEQLARQRYDWRFALGGIQMLEDGKFCVSDPRTPVQEVPEAPRFTYCVHAARTLLLARPSAARLPLASPRRCARPQATS